MSNALNLTVRFNALDSLSGALKNIIGLGRTGDQALRGLKGQARDLKAELRGVEQELGRGTGNVTALIERQRQLESAIEGVNRQMERQKRLGAIDGRVARVKARGEELKSSGQQNMIAGAGLITPFVLAGKAAMDFSSGMVDIQQKAELSNAETAQMARNIIAAAEAAHQLPEAMRSGVDTLSGLGMMPTEAAQIIGAIGRVGTAFKVDLADGAQSAYANINNLKIGLNQTGRALDIMAAGGNAGAFELRDMAKFFPGLTAQAQALGQSGLGAVADLTAALQIARRATGTADEAGTNVQNLLAKINSPTVIAAFQKKFKVDLPAALKAAYAKGKTPMEALAEITNKALGGDLGKLGFVVEDMQAQSALRALILNMEDYRKIRAQIASSGGTTDKAFSQRELQDASVAWMSFKGTISALAITLGTTLLPVATQFFGYLNTGIGAVSRWAQANPEAARSLMTLAAGLGAARVGFGVLQFALGSIIGPFATAWGWYRKFNILVGEAGSVAAAFPRIAKAFGVLRTAALFLGQGMMRAGLMMLANPMVLAIVAIGAAIALVAYLVYNNWDRIKGAFSAGLAMLGSAANWIKAKIVQFPMLFGPLGLVAAFIITHWGAIRGAFNSGVAMIGGAWTAVKGKFDAGVAMVKGALTGLPGWLTSLGGMMMTGLLSALNPTLLAGRLLAIARSGIAAFKNFFGIKSPSRLFMAMGGHITSGLALGIDGGARHPLRSVGRMASGVAAAGALSLSPAWADTDASQRMAGMLSPGQIAPGNQPEFAPLAAPSFAPLSPRADRSGPRASGTRSAPITIQIFQQPGEDADALADRVMRKMEERQRREGLSSYQDDF